MSPAARDTNAGALHLPVLIDAILENVDPSGTWLDGTFGAGGYARAFLEAGAARIIGIDRDPLAFDLAAPLKAEFGTRLELIAGTFAEMETLAAQFLPLDGVVLDLGVSSMQLDRPERGFSFLKDGPLDMRMAQGGQSAADLLNRADEAEIADILFQYGEERASRRIARAIVAARPLRTTAELVAVIETCLPRGKPGTSHPATRSFQALRIAVNDELGQLIGGLEAAENCLKSGGYLAVVTFHSLEDRVVKKFLANRSGQEASGSRHAPTSDRAEPTFTLSSRKAITASADELARNPRSRSAKLRVARRTAADPRPSDRAGLGLPKLANALKRGDH